MNPKKRPRWLGVLAGVSSSLAVTAAYGQDAPAPPTGAPPPEAKAQVEGPKGTDEPKIEERLDGSSVSLSSGGVLTSGNSRLLAFSGSGAYDTRFNNNGIGVAILGNYGQGAGAGKSVQVTSENIQGRLRYDRYVADAFALFLLNTLRHDRFQGLDLRYNLDPGVKYLFLKSPSRTVWGEAGYDLQYDIRRNEDRVILDASKAPVLDASGNPTRVDKTKLDHSARLFAGFKYSFNKEVTLTSGLEYLQSVVDSTRYRLNFDALVAAKVGAGLALGVGFSARYDHAPLGGKEGLDTSTTVSLIYAFSDVPEPAKPKTCPCPEPPTVADVAPVPAASPAAGPSNEAPKLNPAPMSP